MKVDIKKSEGFLTVSRETARGTDRVEIPYDEGSKGKVKATGLVVLRKKDYNRVLKIEETDAGEIVVVYTVGRVVKVVYGSAEVVYRVLLRAKSYAPLIRMSRKGLWVYVKSGVQNPYGLKIEGARLYLCDRNYREFTPRIYERKTRLRDCPFYKGQAFFFHIDELIYENASFNCSLQVQLKVGGVWISYAVAQGILKKRMGKLSYPPKQAVYYKDWALHIRNTLNGNVVLVRRLKEPIEYDRVFRFKESRLISFSMYYLSRAIQKITGVGVNLYFEKFASKNEEGAYDIFKASMDGNTGGNHLNFFVIDRNSEDYPAIKDEKNILIKYTWRYYWYLYRVSNIISTETPSHVNMLRGMNRYVRLALNKAKFIFLQHGVTYLKCQGPTTAFAKGKEGYPDYMIVNSAKERDIVSELLDLPTEHIVVSGMPIFSRLKWESITQDSPDKVTVMLTWKPYEEYITDFSRTTYYKNTVAVYEMLKRYIPVEDIIVIAHPKIAELMKGTEFEKTIWNKPISQALSQTKLLITDYSSVCYNTFYQGGGVVFYQPDLEYYEEVNGTLIPRDDEYIGYRVYDMASLEESIRMGIKNSKIDLGYFRSNKFIENYLTINEFNDGKNTDRIVDFLRDKKLI